MLPKVFAEPCTTCIGCSPRSMFARSGELPRVTHHVSQPAFCAVKCFGCSLARRHNRLSEIDKRFMQFREVADLHRPIIHLYVDIQVVITVPGSLHLISPQPLQVEWKRVFAGTADHQVTAVLEVESGKCRIVVRLETGQAFVGRRGVVLFAQLEFHTIELLFIRGYMCLFHFRERAVFSLRKQIIYR